MEKIRRSSPVCDSVLNESDCAGKSTDVAVVVTELLLFFLLLLFFILSTSVQFFVQGRRAFLLLHSLR